MDKTIFLVLRGAGVISRLKGNFPLVPPTNMVDEIIHLHRNIGHSEEVIQFLIIVINTSYGLFISLPEACDLNRIASSFTGTYPDSLSYLKDENFSIPNLVSVSGVLNSLHNAIYLSIL